MIPGANLILDGAQLAERDALDDLAEEEQAAVAKVNEHPNAPRLTAHRAIRGHEQAMCSYRVGQVDVE